MKKFLAALAVVAACSLTFATVPASKSTAQTTSDPVVIEIPIVPADTCNDEFSAAVKKDLVGRVDEGKPSLALGPYMGDEILIFQSSGYCRELDEVGKTQTPEELAKSIVAELQGEATKYNYKITYISKVTQVLGGSSIALVVTPPPEKIAQAGVEYRILQVFVFNKTRIVGIQLFVTVTGLKTP